MRMMRTPGTFFPDEDERNSRPKSFTGTGFCSADNVCH